MKKKYFENLDGLRFVAFLGVFLYHHNYLFADFFKNHRLTSVLFDQGETAVSFFFVLSGFLISYILMIEKQNRTQINLINFFKKRILRILPLYFLIVLVGFVFIPMMTQGLTHSSFYVPDSDLLKTGIIGLNLGATTGISYLSYNYFEAFFLNLKQKKV